MKRIANTLFLLAMSLLTTAQALAQSSIEEANRKYVFDQNDKNTISYIGKKAGKTTNVMFYKLSLTEDSKCISENLLIGFSTMAILCYDNDQTPMGLTSSAIYQGIGSRIKDFALNVVVTNTKDVPIYLDLSESCFTNNCESKPIVDKSLYGNDDFYKSKYHIKLNPKETKMLDKMLLGVLKERSSYGGPKNTMYLSANGPVLALGEQKQYTYEESPYKYTVSISYSTDSDYRNKSMLTASFYVSEILGGPWDSMMNTVKVKDLNIEGNPFYFFGKNSK